MDMYKNLIDALEKKREILRKRVEKIEAGFRSVHSQDSEDRATESESDEVFQALDDVSRQEIQLIDDAIKRFENNQYGTCTACEGKIQIKRLEAIPYATMCIECASSAS